MYFALVTITQTHYLAFIKFLHRKGIVINCYFLLIFYLLFSKYRYFILSLFNYLKNLAIWQATMRDSSAKASFIN